MSANWDAIYAAYDRKDDALKAAKEKLEAYRNSGFGDFVGGPEYETLMRQINEALK